MRPNWSVIGGPAGESTSRSTFGGTEKEMKELILSAMWVKPIDGWMAQKTGSDSRESMTQIGG